MSLEEQPESKIHALWARGAERRLDELEQGQVAEVSADEVLRRAMAAIGGHREHRKR